MGDAFERGVLYRILFGQARDRLERFDAGATPETIRAELLARPGLIDPAVFADPVTVELIQDAIADAVAGRRPRW